MTVVIGAAEEILETLPADDHLAQSARLGSLAGQRAARLVQALMIYSGVAPLGKAQFALDEMLEEIAERERRRLPTGVTLITDLRAGRATMRLPRDLFAQAVEGLLANARAAVGRLGRIMLASRWIGSESAGDQVSISIVDNGIGMAAETLRRVAEPFFTTRMSSDSTGLGVPLADGFARQTGGNLHIDSALDRATRVELVLPAAVNARSMIPRRTITPTD